MKQLILDTVSDLVSNFLYYDRREDEDLPRESIHMAIMRGEITIEDIVRHFEKELKEGVE